LAAATFARIFLAPFTGTVRPAAAENGVAIFNGEKMHCNEVAAAFAFARLFRNGIAGAVILAVTDIVNFAFISSHDQSERNKQYCYDE
jgi:hypothetical protein